MKKIKLLAYISITLFGQLIALLSFSQDSLVDSYTEVNSITLVKSITRTINSCFAPTDFSVSSGLDQLNFKKGVVQRSPIPNHLVTKTLVLKFNLYNKADTAAEVCFFPGYYYKSVILYRLKNGQPEKINTRLPDHPDNFCFSQFTMPPHDSATIIAELKFARTYSNSIRPRLVNPAQIETHIASVRNVQADTHILTYVFCGLLLMMIFFSLSNYIQGANREFLYYAFYAFFIGSMLSTKAFYDLRPSRISIYLEEYLDFILQCLGILFYMVFMQKLLSTKQRYPFLHKLYNGGIALLVVSMAAYTFLHYFTDNFALENLTEIATKILLLILVLVFLIYSARHLKDKLLRFLFWGNLFLFIFSLLSQAAIMFENSFSGLPGFFNSALFYYEMGLLIEFIFFLAGLNYKNRRRIIDQTKEKEMLKAQNLLQEYEKELAVLKGQQQERERISADMHDELGAGMTAIRLMSEIARNKMKENTPVEIEKISSSANEVLNKMNAIIWSMNSGNDTLDNLISYIRSYAPEYFEATSVTCKIIAPDDVLPTPISGDKRRNIFLSVKKSLNNILKHAGASAVVITITAGEMLTITIADNGKGIDKDHLRQFGNGLKNIARRMENIGGHFSIENNNGTVTTLSLPL